jgi:hypothetical protein
VEKLWRKYGKVEEKRFPACTGFLFGILFTKINIQISASFKKILSRAELAEKKTQRLGVPAG